MQVEGLNIKLNPNITQKTKEGKNFRVSCIGFDHAQAPRWVNKQPTYPMYLEVIVEEKERIRFSFNNNDELVKKERI